MNDFFRNDMRRHMLIKTVESWIDTPFSPHGNQRHLGADCVGFPAEVYRECGVFDDYHFPRYTMDGGNHLEKSAVIFWLELHPNFTLVEGETQVGDLLLFKLKKVEHHCAIQLRGTEMAHCLYRRSVSYDQRASMAQSFTRAYRPMERAES